MNSHIESMRNKGRRCRGSRLHIGRGAQYQTPSLNTPLMWRQSPSVHERSRMEAERQEVEAMQECQAQQEEQTVAEALRTVDEGDARQFACEANRRESAAVSMYGMAAYDREDIRRDERGRILR